MTAIYLTQFAICLSCAISSFGFDEFFNQKIEGSPLTIYENDTYKKQEFYGKQKEINKLRNFTGASITEDETRTTQNDYLKYFYDKFERNIPLTKILNAKHDGSRERVERYPSNRNDNLLRTTASWRANHSTPKRLWTPDPEVKKKTSGFNKTKKSYDNQFLFLQPHVFDHNIVPNSKSFINRNGRNENITIFSFIDQNGNLDFRNNFTANLLNAVRHGSSKEIMENITKIASQTLKPENFTGNRWSSDWFEVSLKNQPSNDVKISSFNRLLGMDKVFPNKTTNSNFSLIQILKNMIEQQGDAPKELYENHSIKTNEPSIGNLINSLDSNTYSNSEVLNYIINKIKRASLDFSQNSRNLPKLPSTLPLTLPQVGETSHEFLTNKFMRYSQSQIPQNEFNLRFSQSSSEVRPTKSTNIWNVFDSFPHTVKKKLDEIDERSLIATSVEILAQPTKTFSINLDSIQFLLPQELIETKYQVYPSKIILKSESENKITDSLYDQVVTLPISGISKEFVNQYTTEKISITPHQSTVTMETVSETLNLVKEETPLQPTSPNSTISSTSVPSYFYLSGSKMWQLKFIINEFLANHILERYNFPTGEKYKNHYFYANVKYWAENLSEALIKDPERIANSSSVLLKADTKGEISAYIYQMTDEVLKKESKKNKESMALEKVFEQLHSKDKEEFYTQADMNSIKEFVKIVFYSNSHLRNAIDKSFEEFVVRSAERKSQDLNDERQILSSLYSSSVENTSEKSEIYVSHYILPQEGHYYIASQSSDPLKWVNPIIKNANDGMASYIDASKDPHKCFDFNSGVSNAESLAACPDNYGDFFKTTLIPTFSTNHPNDFFNTRLLTLQKPLLGIFNAQNDWSTANTRSVISDVLPFTKKLEYVTKIFYSNNVETSTVVTKTVKYQILTKASEDTIKEFMTTASLPKSILSLKSAYLNSLAKPFNPSSVYIALNFPRSKTEADFTIDVTRVITDTKFASILSNSLSSKASTTVQKDMNSKTLGVPAGFPHGNEFSITTRPFTVNHPSHPHDFTGTLSNFINKLLLLQILLLVACKKPQNGSTQAVLHNHNQIGSMDLKKAVTSSFDSLQNSTSNGNLSFDSNFTAKHNFSDITKILEINLASLLNENFYFSLPELKNGKIALTALFSKGNFSLSDVKDFLNDTEAYQYLHNNVNNNNLALMLQNAINVIANTEKSDHTDVLKEEVKKLDHDINELEKQILEGIDLKADSFVGDTPTLETSFATSFGISKAPSLSSFATPGIAEVMSSFVISKPNSALYQSASVISSLLPIGLRNNHFSKVSKSVFVDESQTVSIFTLNNEIENFMNEFMNSENVKLPNEESNLANRLKFGVLSSLPVEYLPTQASVVKNKNYFLSSNHSSFNIDKVAPSYLDKELEKTKIKTSTITVYQNLFDISQPFLTLQNISAVTEIPTTALPIGNDLFLNSDTKSFPSQDSHTGSNLTNELLKLYQGYSSTLDNYLMNHKISNRPDQEMFIEHKNLIATSNVYEVTTPAFEKHSLNTIDVSTGEKIPNSTCDGIGSRMETNFINPSYPLPDREKGICTFRLYIRDPLICQVRVDFVKSVMIAPTEGQCVDQVFGVQGTIEVPSLNSYCGTNEDQHFYIQLKNNTLGSNRWIDFSLNTRTNKHFYKYDILISQIRCVNDEQLYAPRGCLQFHSGSLGILKSFNFEEKEYLSDVNYNICIKKTIFGCEAIFTAADGDFGIQKHNSRIVPQDSSGVGIHACARDYVAFEGLELRNGSQRICGAKFSYIQGDLANRPVVVTTKRSLYLIQVKSGNPFTFDRYNRGPGFRLSFHQRTNC